MTHDYKNAGLQNSTEHDQKINWVIKPPEDTEDPEQLRIEQEFSRIDREIILSNIVSSWLIGVCLGDYRLAGGDILAGGRLIVGTLSIKSTALAGRIPKTKLKQAVTDKEPVVILKSTPKGRNIVIPPIVEAVVEVKPEAQTAKKAPKKPVVRLIRPDKPEIIIEGQRSVYWYANYSGLYLAQKELIAIGQAAGAHCKELGVEMGCRRQVERYPKDKTVWYVMARTYPVEILELAFESYAKTLNIQIEPNPVTTHLTEEAA